MAAAVQVMQSSTSTALSQPHTAATTATVREHACLFTHDLRRKQKRWQDGRLKYHTFNKRVMVHDERGNFVGDTHWREDYDLAEGDDLELDRGGVIIQVGECVGSRDQDLSELVDKRAQEKAERQAAAAAAAAARRPPTTPIVPRQAARPQPLLQKHLHDVIGTPSGHHGRAVVPKESPYDERQQQLSEDNRPAKRRRREISPPRKSGYAQNLFGAALTLSGQPSSQVFARQRLPKVSHAREETVTPPSSDASNRENLPITPTDITCAPRAMHSSPVSKTSLQAENELAQGPSRQEPSLYANQETTAERGKEKPPLRKQQNSAVSRRKNVPHRQPALASTSSKHDLGGLDEAERADSTASLPNKPPTPRQPKKSLTKEKLRAENRHNPEKRPPNTNTVDLTEDAIKTQLIDEEPRTELRIKPRKKRGLLMIAERHVERARASRLKQIEPQPAFDNLPSPSKAQHSYTSLNIGGQKARSTGPQRERVGLAEETGELSPPQNRSTEATGDENRGDFESCDYLQDDEDARHLPKKHGSEGSQHLCQSRPCPRLNTEASFEEKLESDKEPARKSTIETGRHLRPRERLPAEHGRIPDAAEKERARNASFGKEVDMVVEETRAPRLAKLGRKSIKSREVIGFIFDEESDSEPALAVQLSHQIQQEPAIDCPQDQALDSQPREVETADVDGLAPLEAQPNIGLRHKTKGNYGDGSARPDVKPQSRGKTPAIRKETVVLPRQKREKSSPRDSEVAPAMPSEEAPAITPATVTQQSRILIPNPATRGKKAAKPSDAAGQMPVCPLPIEPTGNSSLNQMFRKTNAHTASESRNTEPLPGFSKVNGGPWSREAHDLFDFKRPS
ncbi:hypothetical protein F4808DRAFT_424006 [Astrocystis sublimbata]|nr:hypothetical protein F4808DRAFT_424006 [Astrocystis sublimbata]